MWISADEVGEYEKIMSIWKALLSCSSFTKPPGHPSTSVKLCYSCTAECYSVLLCGTSTGLVPLNWGQKGESGKQKITVHHCQVKAKLNNSEMCKLAMNSWNLTLISWFYPCTKLTTEEEMQQPAEKFIKSPRQEKRKKKGINLQPIQNVQESFPTYESNRKAVWKTSNIALGRYIQTHIFISQRGNDHYLVTKTWDYFRF